MAEFYVDDAIAASGDGSSAASAFKTIGEALAASAGGADVKDKIVVAEGVYTENLSIAKSVELVSSGGRDATTIVGTAGAGGPGTINVAAGVNDVTIGATGQGFEVIGFDNPGQPGQEPAAIYLTGAHSNIVIQGNEIVAKGDLAINSQYGFAIDGALIDGNIISGTTFDPNQPIPDFTTFSASQFNLDNVPRVLVYFGNSNKTGIVFTNNEVTGTTGGVDASGDWRGNTIVVLDGANNTASGNTFEGVNHDEGDLDNAPTLRMNGPGMTITGNSFDRSTAGGVSTNNPSAQVADNAIVYGDGADRIFAAPGNDDIDGGLGTDTYDMTGAGTSGSFVDLASGLSFSSATGIDSIVNVENVKGSSGADGLYGDGGANVFEATAGSDVIDGRGGFDTFDASSATASVDINLTQGSVSGAFTANLTAIEDAEGGAGADILVGTTGDNNLVGNGGADSFNGRAGNDVLDGGEGMDRAHFSGAASDYTITAGANAGEVSIVGPDGADTLVNVEELIFSEGSSVWVVKDGAELTHALANAGEGDTIKLADGEYVGNFVIDTAGVTIESLSGNADEVVLQGGFKSVNNVPDGTTVAEWLETATAYNGTPAGVVVSANDVTISNITIREYRTGVDLQSNSGLTIDGVILDENIFGVYKENGAAEVVDFKLIGGRIEDGYIGVYSQAAPGAGEFSAVLIDGTTFERLTQKGLYFEQLSDAELRDLVMNDVGQYGGGPAFGANGLNGAGIDINLKYGDYSNIVIKDFDFTDVGLSDGLGFPHSNGGAIHIKARDDGSYGSNPAALDGVTIENGSIDGTSTGIRVGEPGKTTEGPTNLTISGVEITDAATGSYDNRTTTPRTVTLTEGDDVVTTNADSTGAFNYIGGAGDDDITGGSAADTIDGGDGADELKGGGGNDTATYEGAIDARSSVAFDAANNVWTVTAGDEGTDTLSDIEIIESAGEGAILLVGGDGFASIQAAVDAAADGDTILVASGTWTGNVTIVDKELTILGVNEGVEGAARDSGAAESSIVGRVLVSGSKDVVIDGVEIRATGATGTTGINNPALEFRGSGDYVIANTVFYSTVTGGGAADTTAIGLFTYLSGGVTIDGNLFTGSTASNFGPAPWGRGVWSDGSSSDLDITDNVFRYLRTALNLDGYDDAITNVSGNDFESAGTAISIGLPTGDTFAGIDGNEFGNVGSGFNFRNVNTPIEIDLSESDNVPDVGQVMVLLGGRSGDALTGSDHADYIVADGYLPNETLSGAIGGDDTVVGGEGNDTIFAGLGDDSISGGAGDDSLVGFSGDDTMEGGAGDDMIDGGDGVDEAAYEEGATLSIVDGKWTVVSGDDVDTLANVEKVVLGTKTYILVDKETDGGFGTIHEAVNVAAGGETILIAPGDYLEDGTGGNIYESGLEIDKSGITLQGVDSLGAAITDQDDVLAVVRSNYSAADNTTIRVSGEDVTISGLSFSAPSSTPGLNNAGSVKALLSVMADGVTIENSVFATGKASYAIEVNGPNITSYVIDGNEIGGPIWILNDAGNGGGDEQITNNVFTGSAATGVQSGIYIMGANVASYSPGAPTLPPVITGNVFADGIPAPLFVRTNNAADPDGLLTVEYVEAFIDGNMSGESETYAYVIDDATGEIKLTATSAANVNSDAIVASSLDVLNTYQTTGLTVGSGAPIRRDMISASDIVVVKTVGETNVTLYDDNLTIRAVAGSDELNLTLSNSAFAGAAAGHTQAVTSVTIADYADGFGADVDVTGNGLGNTIRGNSGQNIIDGGAGDDVLQGGAGSDVIRGGAGTGDEVVFEKSFASYSVSQSMNGTYVVVDKATGDTDLVSGVEQFTFAGVTTTAVPGTLIQSGPTITDVTDSGANEDGDAGTFVVEEDAAIGAAVAQVSASDPNAAAGDTLTYSLVTAEGAAYTGPFAIDAATGAVTVSGPLDHEAAPTAELIVRVTDGSGASDDQAITVTIADVNEAPTAVTLNGGDIDEATDRAIAGTLSVVDPEGDAEFSFEVSDDRFTVQEIGGAYVLRLKDGESLDYEAPEQTVTLTVTATDAGGKEFSEQITLDVQDVNEAPTGIALDNLTVDEESEGAVIGVLSATDPEGDEITFSVDDDRFVVEVIGGEAVLRLAEGVSLDYETEQDVTIDVLITAMDSGVPAQSSSHSFTIAVQDLPEPPIGQSNQEAIMEQGATDAPLNLTPLIDPEGDEVSYTVIQLPSEGAVRLNGVAVAAGSVLTAAQFAALTYTAPDGVSGAFTLQIEAADGTAAPPEAVTVSLVVEDGVSTTYLGSSAGDRLDGAFGNDSVAGLGGDDTLLGGSGDDTVDGGAGADQMIGGSGNDIYIVDNIGDTVTEAAAGGLDTVLSSVDYRIGLNVENLTLTGTAKTGSGNAGNNLITGNAAINVLLGGAGADTLNGAGGNDILIGGLGGDSLIGGAGAGDTASYTTAQSSVTVNLSSGVNVGDAAGDSYSGIEKFVGSAHGDTFVGDAGANQFAGAAGNDTLAGLGGNDTLDGGEGLDTADYGAAVSSVSLNLSIAGAQATGGAGSDTLVSIENVVGSGFADTIAGSSENNVISAGGANDLIYGRAGADSLDGGVGADSLVGGEGNDTLAGGADSDTAFYADATGAVNVSLGDGVGVATGGGGNDALLSIENVIGSRFADILTGDNFENLLEGRAGADQITGGGGADRFVYNSASESALTSRDHILDFSNADGDKIDLSRIDANTVTAGNNVFTFVAGGATSGAGTVAIAAGPVAGQFLLLADVNGGGADLSILVTGAIDQTSIIF